MIATQDAYGVDADAPVPVSADDTSFERETDSGGSTQQVGDMRVGLRCARDVADLPKLVLAPPSSTL